MGVCVLAMAVETENLETDLSLAQRFQQLHVRKSRPKFGGLPMNGFKEFLLRGNVIDMAVGIVVRAAFGPVVPPFFKDLRTPFIRPLLPQPPSYNTAFPPHIH